MLRYALTIFLSAFLLFQVQPLISKIILPWFGGTPGVWTACMLFFQLVLLAGYTYAHVVATRLAPRKQVIVHLVVLVAAAALLPIIPAERWKPAADGNPTWQILALLGVCVGLPYFMLATTSPLMQAWFARTHPGRSPYRLYALSNVGSLLALLSFPFVFEPEFTLRTQAWLWSGAFVAVAALVGWCAMRTWNVAPSGEWQVASGGSEGGIGDSQSATAPPGIGRRLMWLLLPACGSVMFLAVTNQMCLDVAVIPFLWVLPLGLYLLTFIICFDNERWYFRPFFWLWLVGSVLGITYLLQRGAEASIREQIIYYSLGLFGCCMVCHGELVRLKPSPRYLTSFYLMVSAGGALGGIFVSLVAVSIFNAYLELHYGLWATCALAMLAFWLDKKPHRLWPASWFARVLVPLYFLAPVAVFLIEGRNYAMFTKPSLPLIAWGACGVSAMVVWVAGWLIRRPWPLWRWAWLWMLPLPLFVSALVFLGGELHRLGRESLVSAVSMSRNFYGVLKVAKYHQDDPDREQLILSHGRINHGAQLTSDEGRRRPITYFSERSGIGLALLHHPRKDQGLRVGVLGLGTGTIAVYGQKGDVFRFYEINPRVRELSGRKGVDCPNPVFTYLTDTEADCRVILGDGRLSLERQESQQFDILAMDAFSSDAVPIHLLTKEVFDTYLRHIKPDGIIAVNITNRHLDLRPVVWAVADHFGLKSIVIRATGDYSRDIYYTGWMLVTRNDAFLRNTAVVNAMDEDNERDDDEQRRTILWTDDYSNLFRIIKK